MVVQSFSRHGVGVSSYMTDVADKQVSNNNKMMHNTPLLYYYWLDTADNKIHPDNIDS